MSCQSAMTYVLTSLMSIMWMTDNLLTLAKAEAEHRPIKSLLTSPTEIIDKLLSSVEKPWEKPRKGAHPPYNREEPPGRGGHPTQIRIGIYANSFYSINEQLMEYSVSFYLRQEWVDPRLDYSDIAHPSVTKLNLLPTRLRNIWLPDTFFRNEKKANFHEVSVDNKLFWLFPKGRVWYVSKVTATLSCMMKLHRYPMDTQICPMMFESFSYTMDVMFLSWWDTPVDVDPSLQLPQFFLREKLLFDCSQNYTAGSFSCLEIRFVLQRDFGYFLIQIYMPSFLIVVISWVSFWLNVEASPARVSLGLLTVLTLTTQIGGVNQSLPRVSYIKAIDVWMSVCLVFSFAGLIEYAIVNVYSRRPIPSALPALVRRQPRAIPVRRLATEALNEQMAVVDSFPVSRTKDGHWGDNEGKSRARIVDRIARRAFPLAFLTFNLVYWTAYALPSLASIEL